MKDNVSYRLQNKCMCVFWIIQTLFAESCLYDKLFTSVILSRSDECSKLQDVKAIPTCFSKTYQQGCSAYQASRTRVTASEWRNCNLLRIYWMINEQIPFMTEIWLFVCEFHYISYQVSPHWWLGMIILVFISPLLTFSVLFYDMKLWWKIYKIFT